MLLRANDSDHRAIETILALDIPTYRAAYSDRTSWFMACFSELAYIKYENALVNDDRTKKLFEQAVKTLLNTKQSNQVNQILENFAYDPEEGKKEINENLNILGYEKWPYSTRKVPKHLLLPILNKSD